MNLLNRKLHKTTSVMALSLITTFNALAGSALPFENNLWKSDSKDYMVEADSMYDGDYISCRLYIRTKTDNHFNNIHLTVNEVMAFNRLTQFKSIDSANQGYGKRHWIEFDNDRSNMMTWNKRQINGIDDILERLKTAKTITMHEKTKLPAVNEEKTIDTPVDMRPMGEALKRFSQCRKHLQSQTQTQDTTKRQEFEWTSTDGAIGISFSGEDEELFTNKIIPANCKLTLGEYMTDGIELSYTQAKHGTKAKMTTEFGYDNNVISSVKIDNGAIQQTLPTMEQLLNHQSLTLYQKHNTNGKKIETILPLNGFAKAYEQQQACMALIQ